MIYICLSAQECEQDKWWGFNVTSVGCSGKTQTAAFKLAQADWETELYSALLMFNRGPT